MSQRCANGACTWNDGGPCARSASLPPGDDCPDLGTAPIRTPAGAYETGAGAGTPGEDSEGTTPHKFWMGTALGIDELALTLWGPDPRLFLCAGSENAGKTSLLVGIWIELANGRAANSSWRFAGSRSLRGWTQIADAAFSWKEEASHIVPRTSIADVRQPSFLHLHLSQDLGETSTQVLLSDLPGEWFERWSIRRDAGAEYLPLLPRVDGSLLVVDTPRLLKDDQYLDECKLLRDRIRESAGSGARPVALVLTKADLVDLEASVWTPATMTQWNPRLLKRVRELADGFTKSESIGIFSTSILSVGGLAPRGTLAPLLWLIGATIHQTVPNVSLAPRHSSGHPFGWVREPFAGKTK